MKRAPFSRTVSILARTSLLAAPLALAAACSAESSPAEESVATASSPLISDILTMTRREDGRYDVVCRDNSREVRSADEIAAQQVCQGTGGGVGVVIYGRSDSCSSGDAVAAVDETTDCSAFSDSDVSWSVKVNGQCINISDTTARRACINYKPARAIIYGRSDSCGADDAVAAVNDAGECNSLSDTDPSWSIKVNGQCRNISDTTVRRACFEAQNN